MSEPRTPEERRRADADLLEAMIANALKAQDLEAAVDLLKGLFAVDQERGTAVYEAMQTGIAIRSLVVQQ